MTANVCQKPSDLSMNIPRMHCQIGAPSLIHRLKKSKRYAFLDVPEHQYPSRSPQDIAETLQRRHRLGTRWYYDTCDVLSEKEHHQQDRKRKNPHHTPVETRRVAGVSSHQERLENTRAKILSQHAAHRQYKNKYILESYQSYDAVYAFANFSIHPNRKKRREPRLDVNQRAYGRRLALQRQYYSDPAHLASFGSDALEIAKEEFSYGDFRIDKSKITSQAPRSRQGNCLLCVPCPCPNCNREPSWIIIHPNGALMDKLVASNLLTPHGRENAGHIYDVKTWLQDPRKRGAAKRTHPNEIALDDTILEIQQCGKWDSSFLEGTLIVRTSVHISVVSISATRPDLSTYDSRSQATSYDDSVCWGNYVLKQQTRIDLRSFIPRAVSYRPLSVACHPHFGNEFTDPKFAFVSYSEHSGEQTSIHNFQPSEPDAPICHHIPSLRDISAIDYTPMHPMCLWCVGSSYVRPTLVPDTWFKRLCPFGLGRSIYTVDMRSNIATFQWSPSADAMRQEGSHSINGIVSDWGHEHRLWASSSSAGKTWEIDSRMPCRVVNSWSVASSCDHDSVSFPHNGPYGDPIVFSMVKEHTNGKCSVDPNMMLTLDTSPASFGFQLLQLPSRKPRFQTDSLETIPSSKMGSQSSICSTSLFAHPESSIDIYTCGVASFRTPITAFVSNAEMNGGPFREEDKVLCTLTMTQKGDIFCHSLLETDRQVPERRSFPGLPVGVAAIPVPAAIEGKTNPVEHKRWKPTGGMNLKLFWSNQYPSSYHAKQFVPALAIKDVHPSQKKTENHRSYKTGKDHELQEIIAPPRSQEGIQIAAVDASENVGNGILNSTGQALVISQELVDKAHASRASFRDIADDNDNNFIASPKVKMEADEDADQTSVESHDDDLAEPERRSDMDPELIRKAAATWKMWENLDQEDGSSDEDGNKGHLVI